LTIYCPQITADALQTDFGRFDDAVQSFVSSGRAMAVDKPAVASFRLITVDLHFAIVSSGREQVWRRLRNKIVGKLCAPFCNLCSLFFTNEWMLPELKCPAGNAK
jgi:hypothetical protein